MNHNVKGYIVIICMIILATILIIACSPVRKIEKAEQIVITHPQSFQKVGLIWRELNKCTNDTTIINIHDTTVSVLDRVVNHTDTVIKNGIQYIMRLDTAFFEKTKTITVKQSVSDIQNEKLLRDSINKLNRRMSAYEQSIIDLTTVNKQERASTNGWMWKSIITWIVAAAGICLFIYIKVFK